MKLAVAVALMAILFFLTIGGIVVEALTEVMNNREQQIESVR